MSTIPQPSAPPLYPKPDTRWDVLHPLETTTKTTWYRIYQLFVGVGFASGLGKYVAARRLTGTPDFIINTCYALGVISVGSLVGGAVLWFFNRLEISSEKLRQERIKVGQEIQPLTVAALFTKAKALHASIFPKEELNEWIRYFLFENPFEVFLREQTRGIYTLPLDDTTKGFLKDRAIDYFQQPHVQITLPVLRALPLYNVLDLEGKDYLATLIANREAAKLPPVVDATTYGCFIFQQGVEVLSCLNSEQLTRLYTGFANLVYQSEKGILALESDHVKEWAAFGEVTKKSFFQDVANREASQPYPAFIKRNGILAIEMVTNTTFRPKLLQSFITHVVSQHLGLVETKKLFWKEINLFEAKAYQAIEFEVLEYETKCLQDGKINYKQFRTRNGFVNNPLYRLYFLALPYADLVAFEYEQERTQWKVTRESIKETLHNRWQRMLLKDVLSTDADGFWASMQGSPPYFSPRDWTDKAVGETQTLSVKEVITTYKHFFTAGVLTAQDGRLNDRLLTEIASFTDWTAFFEAYGPFVFQYFSIAQSTKVVALIRSFIAANAEGFLTQSYDNAILPYVQAVEEYGLDSFCKDLLAAKRMEKIHAEKTFSDRSRVREKACNDNIQARQDQAKKAVAEFESHIDLPGKRERKEKAKRNHAKLDASYKALENGLREGGERLLQMMMLIQEKQTRLSALQQELERLQNYALQFQRQFQAGHAQAVKVDLQNAEAALQNHPPLKQLQGELATARKESQELQQRIGKIEDLKGEWTQLNITVKNEELVDKKKGLQALISNPPKVTGLQAAQKAKQETEEAQKKLQAMKEQGARFRELQKLLSKNDYQIDPLRARLVVVKALILQKQGEAEAMSTSLDFSSSQSAGYWQKLAAQMQFTLNEIAQLSSETNALRLEQTLKKAADEATHRQLPTLRSQLKNALDEQSTAKSVYDKAVLNLSQKKREIEEACTRDVQAYQLKKASEIALDQSQRDQTLGKILRSLKENILVA